MPTKQYKKLFELDDVKPEFTPDALEEAANLAVKRKIVPEGCVPSWKSL